MRPTLSRRFSSPLARWVRRHAKLTTLFRSPASPAIEDLPALWAENVTASDSDSTPSVMRLLPSVTQTPLQPPTARKVQARRDIPEQGLPMAGLFETLPLETSAEPTPTSKRANLDDTNWRRLQTIFRKHQETEATETAPAPIPENAPMESPKASAPMDKNVPGEPLDTPANAPAHEITSMKLPDIFLEAPASGIGPADHLNASPHASPLASAHEYTPVERLQTPVPLQAVWPVQYLSGSAMPADDEPAVDEEIASEREGHAPILAVPADDKPEQMDIEPPSQRSSTTRESEVENISELPEQKNLPLSSSQHSAVEEAQPNGHPASMSVPSPQRSPATTPAQPPDTLIDVLPPSRPRPHTVTVTSLGSDVAGLPGKQIVQRQLHSDATLREESEPQYIETAIGALPSDLWQLLGQPAPATKTSPFSAAPRVVAPSAQPTPAHITVTTSTLPAPIPLPNVLQRQDQPSVTAPRQGGKYPSASPLEEGGTSPAEIDLDELARRVYAEIRRRLRVERERIGN